jgi:hypothetical protein
LGKLFFSFFAGLCSRLPAVLLAELEVSVSGRGVWKSDCAYFGQKSGRYAQPWLQTHAEEVVSSLPFFIAQTAIGHDASQMPAVLGSSAPQDMS